MPGAVTGRGGLWVTVGGHSGPGFIEIQGVRRTVAEALALPGVREGLHDAEAVVLSLCDATVPGAGVPSLARQFAAATGKPVLAASQQVLVWGTEVLSGQVGYHADGLPRPLPGGTWKLLGNGQEDRDLGTSSLREAYAGLNLTPLPSGPAPAPGWWPSAAPAGRWRKWRTCLGSRRR